MKSLPWHVIGNISAFLKADGYYVRGMLNVTSFKVDGRRFVPNGTPLLSVHSLAETRPVIGSPLRLSACQGKRIAVVQLAAWSARICLFHVVFSV